MNLEIRVHRGVGEISFGSTRADVRSFLGPPEATFKRGDELDMFLNNSLFIYFDAYDRCNAIEVSTPLDPTFQGVSILGRPFSTILAWMRTHDPAVIVEPSGFTSTKLGIGVYAPACCDEPDTLIEALIVHRKR